MSVIQLAEQRSLPDALLRFGIRQLLKQRLKTEFAYDIELQNQRYQSLLDNLRQSPIAIATAAANEQHYEVPAAFYRYALGKHLKYSSCYWDEHTENLDQAEALMLGMTAVRAELQDGQNILELGCGWGSLTLWMAEHLPNSRITAVSNSNSQRTYIEEQAKLRQLNNILRQLNNIQVLTCDVNQLNLPDRYDRIVSVEMLSTCAIMSGS